MAQVSVESTGAALRSDLALAQRALAREADACHLLIRTYNQRLYRLARSILRNDAEAEEAVRGIARRYAEETGRESEVFVGSGPGAEEVGVVVA